MIAVAVIFQGHESASRHGVATRCRVSAVAAYHCSRWVVPSHGARTVSSHVVRSVGR
jgi:hypothetical protein